MFALKTSVFKPEGPEHGGTTLVIGMERTHAAPRRTGETVACACVQLLAHHHERMGAARRRSGVHERHGLSQ